MLIPLLYQLLTAYQSGSNYTQATPTPPPSQISQTLTVSPATTTPEPAVLGAHIGGESQVTSIALLGDSMIQTLGTDLLPLQKSLQKYFPNRQFDLMNFGMSSTTIEMAKSRLDEVIASAPDIIVVESFAYNNFGNTQAGIDRQWLALGAITSTIKQKLPGTKIILATTIAPNSIVYGNGISNLNLNAMDKIERTNTIKIYLQNLVNFAKSQGYPLADAYHLSLLNDQGMVTLISSTDHLHPSEAGKEVFCDTLADTIFNHLH
ncbi:SGNH/GDSL hydrolase family protein [Candidatus Shapirobacteria bacterium]|nr:SGNH/GDSL hydrolase family protein [Candidatus Shapirobacteria bacterium]